MAGEEWVIVMILPLIFIMMAIGIVAFIFWIYMLVDCAKRKFKEENHKFIWIVLIALLGWIGALAYYLAIKYPDKH